MLFPPPPTQRAVPRIVVTGAGIVTALGRGWTANAEGFRLGRRAFRKVTLFDVRRQQATLAAELDLPTDPLPGRLNPRRAARLDRPTQMLLWASAEAWEQSGWTPPTPVSIVVGTTAAGMSLGEDYYRQLLTAPDRRRGQPTRALYYLAQTEVRTVAEALGASGSITVLSNACASGASAIGHAWHMLRNGSAQRVLAGGHDALSQFVFVGFDALRALSPTLCRPFDATRDGLTMGEGAGMLALETLEHAEARRATILGELIGYGTTVDRHHLTQPHPRGDAALGSMRLACAAAGVSPAEVDYLNAHGTGTRLNDESESWAIERWAGNQVQHLSVSSTKASVGHLLGGAGAVEAVVCLMALKGQWLPPQAGLETPDPACRFALVREPRSASLRIALSNSFGFGGVNATLIFRRWR